MPKIVQIGMGGSDVASPPTELTTNLDPALLFEDGTTGDDFIEIDTTTSAERVILGGGGANVHIGTPTVSRTLSVGGEFRVEADGVNDFFQVTNMSGAGSAGINGISQGDINFKLKSSNAYF